MNHFDGNYNRLEFDEDQLHSTYHDRNDGILVASLFHDEEGDEQTQAETREVAREICLKVNTHAALLDALSKLLDWAREHTSPIQPNSPHLLLIAAHHAIAKARP